MNIKFKAFTKTAGKSNHFPKPAIKAIPQWYKNIPTFMNNEKKFKLFKSGEINATIKWCNPFLDALSVGYVICLENDIQVTSNEDGVEMTWYRGGDLITTHSMGQVSSSMIPAEFDTQPYKFTSEWSIKTPKGYSALFTHPLNRTDLPFYTLSGFVDTDNYNLPVNLPFFIKRDFNGIIEAGTPIAQIIPIKRESWSSSLKKFDPEFSDRKLSEFRSKIYRAYKTLFWNRKEYK